MEFWCVLHCQCNMLISHTYTNRFKVQHGCLLIILIYIDIKFKECIQIVRELNEKREKVSNVGRDRERAWKCKIENNSTSKPSTREWNGVHIGIGGTRGERTIKKFISICLLFFHWYRYCWSLPDPADTHRYIIFHSSNLCLLIRTYQDTWLINQMLCCCYCCCCWGKFIHIFHCVTHWKSKRISPKSGSPQCLRRAIGKEEKLSLLPCPMTFAQSSWVIRGIHCLDPNYSI